MDNVDNWYEQSDTVRVPGKSKVFRARSDINWSSLSPFEVQVMRRMTKEVEGVPNFMARLISQLVGGMVKKKKVDVGVQTE